VPKFDLFLMQDVPSQDVIEMARMAEEHGFEHLWLIDSQDVYPDVWVTAALCAVNTSHIQLGPGVTNPLTRHPRVTANAMLTVHELSGGRGILGIGAGDSAVRTLGWKPGLRALREAVEICKEKFREKGVDIPIYIAANAVKSTAYACEEGDGIIFSGDGGRPEELRRRLDRIEVAAKQAGKDVTKFPLLSQYGFTISHNRQEAFDDARGPIAKLVKLLLLYYPGQWPPELEHLKAEAEKMAETYDYKFHLKSHTPHAQTVSDAFLETFGLTGTPEDVLPKFQALWREVEGLNFTFYLRPDGRGRKRSLELFVREVLPKLG